jgi:hypothetical protein
LTVRGDGFPSGALSNQAVVLLPVPVTTTFLNGLIPCDVLSSNTTTITCLTRPHLAADADASDPFARNLQPRASNPGGVQVRTATHSPTTTAPFFHCPRTPVRNLPCPTHDHKLRHSIRDAPSPGPAHLQTCTPTRSSLRAFHQVVACGGATGSDILRYRCAVDATSARVACRSPGCSFAYNWDATPSISGVSQSLLMPGDVLNVTGVQVSGQQADPCFLRFLRHSLHEHHCGPPLKQPLTIPARQPILTPSSAPPRSLLTPQLTVVSEARFVAVDGSVAAAVASADFLSLNSTSLTFVVPASAPAGASNLVLRTAAGGLSVDIKNTGRVVILTTVAIKAGGVGSIGGGGSLTLSASGAGFSSQLARNKVRPGDHTLPPLLTHKGALASAPYAVMLSLAELLCQVRAQVMVGPVPCDVKAVSSNQLNCTLATLEAYSAVYAEFWNLPGTPDNYRDGIISMRDPTFTTFYPSLDRM